jgi:LysM repeat protein
MNNTSPLIPQGATPPRPKSSLYFKILMVLSVHVVVIGGMLLQGCKDTATQAKQDPAPAPGDATAVVATAPNTTTTPVPTEVTTPVNPNIAGVVAGTAGSAAPAPQSPPSSVALVPKAAAKDLIPPAAPGEAKEYVIAKGDTFAVIAHKNGLSVKALVDANPGVDAKKLQVGHKLQIPAGTTAMASTATPGATAEAASAEGDLYVVKSGDTLTRIAKTHGTTFKKIMAMNDLKTTSIHAGQKLKVPTGKPSASEPSATPATAPASASASATPSAAASTRASAAAPGSTSPVAAN